MPEAGLDPQLLEILCCPSCRGELEYDRGASELRCEACAFTYPIVDGIPVLFPLDVKANFDELFGRYWDSEDRAEIYDRFVEGSQSMLGMHNYQGEVRATMEVLGDLDGRRLLDCGCGNGRFFDEFPADLFAVGIDASLNMLRVCRQKERCSRLVCCELEHLPFVDSSFDRVLSVRVIQHLERQREAVVEMDRVLEPAGELVLHLYNQYTTKSIAKAIRMSPRWQPIFNAPFRALFRSMSPFSPWPLDYDLYNSVPQIRRWFRESGLSVVRVRGAGFGFHKWVFDGFAIAAWLERRFPKVWGHYLDASLHLQEFLGRRWPFNLVMEKFVVKGRKRFASDG
jgi:LSD1 subclass zinc finger protein